MGVILANNAVSTLTASITDDATTISIQGADAGKFPALAADEWTPATIIDAANNMEIVKIVARAAAVLTVERAQEGTTAKAFPAGARIDVRITAGSFASLADRDGLKEVAYTGSYNDLIDKPPGTTTATVGAAVAAANGKSTPDDGDFFAGVAAGSSAMFKTTWGNIKSALDVLFYRKAAVDAAVGGRVAKTGDTMTGNLTIQKTFPLLEYGNGGNRWWTYYDTGDSAFKFSYNEAVRFQVNSDGHIWCAAFGSVHDRIEQRALAWANDRVSNLNSRWVSRGEYDTSAQGQWREAPAGAAITGSNGGYNSTSVIRFCYRYFQLFDPVRGWITAHNA